MRTALILIVLMMLIPLGIASSNDTKPNEIRAENTTYSTTIYTYPLENLTAINESDGLNP